MNEGIDDREFLAEVIRRGIQSGQRAAISRGFDSYVDLVARLLPRNLHEQLEQLVNGPVSDGDIIAKSLRDELMDLGLAVRVCCQGEQGYTGATYFGYAVLKTIEEIKAGKRA